MHGIERTTPRLLSPFVFVSSIVWAILRARSYHAVFSLNLCGSTCFGASHLYSATRLVWAPPVFNTGVCDLCRASVRLSPPRPSFVTARVYSGCPAGTHWGDPISRVRPEAPTRAVLVGVQWLRRTRRRGKSRPYVFGFPPTLLFDMVAAVALSIFGGNLAPHVARCPHD